MKYGMLISALFVLISCNTPPGEHELPGPSDIYGNFTVRNGKEFIHLTVHQPWQRSAGEKTEYILAEKSWHQHDSLKNYTVIQVPVKKVIVFSTSHVGFISALGMSHTIAGVSGKDFISDTIVRKLLLNGSCMDVGYAPDIDYEGILRIRPDVVFIYGLDPSVTTIIQRLDQIGIPAVLVSEFLENHPLGKADWIRFFAGFYSCGERADSLIGVVRENYFNWKDSAVELGKKPKILTGLPWKDTWYMSGGKSFSAAFIRDAGGKYLWEDNENSDYIPLDLESVFRKGIHADIWINTGNAASIPEILNSDIRFELLPALKNGFVYNNNLRVNNTGGNDFWESGAVRPDYILSDLVKIFRDPSDPNLQLNYYRKLE